MKIAVRIFSLLIFMKKQKLDLTQHLQNVKKRKIKRLIFTPSLFLLIATPIIIWGVLFVKNEVTIGGVPASVIGKFLGDPTAIEAFVWGDASGLHARLQDLGVEQEIKSYHRPRMRNELELDRYIHQVLYNWTGYIGENYTRNHQGTLVLTESGRARLLQEIKPKAP
jgi:hypothetical protein